MLNLSEPLQVEGVRVWRNDADPALFHVLPDALTIAVDDKGRADFLFLLYLRDATDLGPADEAGAGYLQFRTVLTLPPERRAKVLDALRELLAKEQAAGRQPFGLPITSTEPVLAAPLWTSGQVELETFTISDTGLVRAATGTRPVDLAGPLAASFRADLSPEGADVFRGAFDAYRTGNHELPVLIRYHVNYSGRVAARVTVDASHRVVHERLWRAARPYRFLTDGFPRYVPLALAEPFTVQALPMLRAQYGVVMPMIEVGWFGEVVNQTIVDDEVHVRIENVSTGDAAADTATHTSLLKMAVDLVTQSLLPALSTGGGPLPGASDDHQPAATTSLLALREDAPAGTATFHLDLTDLQTVPMPLDVSAPLHVLVDDPAALRDCFKELRLSDAFFKEMKVTVVTSGVDFARDGIARIHVFYRYDQVDEASPLATPVQRHDDDVLNSAGDTVFFRFDTARHPDGRHKEQYEYRAEVHFTEGGAPAVVPWTPATSRALIITPPLLGAVRVEAVFTADKRYVTSARVELRYRSGSGQAYTGAIELTPDAPRASWFQATGEVTPIDVSPPERRYSYRIIYRVGTAEIARPWITDSAETVEVPNPFTRTLRFAVFPQASFDTVAAIVGDATYDDPLNTYRSVRPFRLAAPGDQVTIDVPAFADGPVTATYTARVERRDGTHETLTGTLAEGSNFVGPVERPATITLEPALLDFAADLRLVQVVLRVTHADGTSDSRTFLFTPAGHAQQTWQVMRRGGEGLVYDADISFFGIDRARDATVHLRQRSADTILLDRAMPGD